MLRQPTNLSTKTVWKAIITLEAIGMRLSSAFPTAEAEKKIWIRNGSIKPLWLAMTTRAFLEGFPVVCNVQSNPIQFHRKIILTPLMCAIKLLVRNLKRTLIQTKPRENNRTLKHINTGYRSNRRHVGSGEFIAFFLLIPRMAMRQTKLANRTIEIKMTTRNGKRMDARIDILIRSGKGMPIVELMNGLM
jgi:hypothetical protein